MEEPPQRNRRLRRPARLRPTAGGRRRRGRGSLFNLTRLFGALLMLAAGASLNWLTSPERFELDPRNVSVEGLHYTPFADAHARLAPELDARPNLFRLRTLAVARALEELPAVGRANVVAGLPDGLRVMVTERVPVMVWQVGDEQLLVDGDGVVIGPAEAGAEDLPVVDDRRSGALAPAIGETLDSIDVSAALRLAALTPASVQSEADAFSLEVQDEHGWLLASERDGWRAAFGHYTPNLRPVSMIDQQVQCLRSLVAEREAELEMVFLAPAEDRCGTFRSRPTPDARIFQNVGRRGAPMPAPE
ncbi:MAG TPA: FtsQ-type POTRA domain-containing protein [Candidatus Limnocylindrales bacterium]|nr:FtsQ-type POTRA domain-containing protein [Candidatus Limnocylindrales bacterium]